MDKMRAIIFSIAFISPNLHAESLSLEQVLQSVIDNYPSIQIAALQVDKVEQNSVLTLGRLGWQLSAQAGASKEIDFTGGTVDQANIGTSLKRLSSSGNTISLQGQSTWANAGPSFSANRSKPGTTSSVQISFRHPLQKGNGNITHHLTLDDNKQFVVLAKAERTDLYNRLAQQITQLYFSAANTLASLENIQQALNRTQRLQKFISGRLNLGIAENKDQLQIDAQFSNQNANLYALRVVWIEQEIALNQLMGKKWNNPISTITSKTTNSKLIDMLDYVQEIFRQDSQLEIMNTYLALAQNKIMLHRENKQNTMDLVMNIGQQVRANGSDDYSETIGGLRIEYNEALDKSGSDAVIFQAQLDRDISLQQISLRQQEIRYEVATLLAGLDAAKKSTQAYKNSIQSELAKLKEADARYRRGRIDIDLLLQFKAQLSTAELSYSLQLIQQNKREYQLARLRGEIWNSIELPKQRSLK